MNNPFDELLSAIDMAKAVQQSVKTHADSMARLLEGNLRSVSSYHLSALKKELRKFNIHTRRWSK